MIQSAAVTPVAKRAPTAAPTAQHCATAHVKIILLRQPHFSRKHAKTLPPLMNQTQMTHSLLGSASDLDTIIMKLCHKALSFRMLLQLHTELGDSITPRAEHAMLLLLPPAAVARLQ
jgi:hypothetical protein